MTLATLPRRLLAAARPPLRVIGRQDEGLPMPAAPGGGFRRGFAAMSHRNYRLYFIGQVVSLVGTWMQSVSLPWLVLLLGGRRSSSASCSPCSSRRQPCWRRSAGCWRTGSTSARR